jgi:hypothetical protein
MKQMLTALLFSTFLMGCGSSDIPPLGPVTGQVLLKGKPLPDAKVIFNPAKGGGRPSGGKTDEDGNFELFYAEGIPGAILGPHKVLITTFVGKDDESDEPEAKFGKKELVPSIYNSQTKLVAEVKKVNEEFVFKLD